jgi:hypothetical protein
MSFADRFVLWLHVGVAVFTIGPVTLAISSTPRYIRKRDVAILRYLARITVIFTVAALVVLILGIVLGQLRHELSKPWLTVAMTLFVVAIVLLVLIIRDQRTAIRAVAETSGAASSGPAAGADDDMAGEVQSTLGDSGDQLAAGATHLASVERGRIAAIGGIVNVIWLVILALMIWQP